MTPEQLQFAEAFQRVTFRPNTPDKKFADAFVATAKKNPGVELTDKQDKYVRDLAFRYRRQMPAGLVIGQVQHGVQMLAWLAPELAKHSKKCAVHDGDKCNCSDAIIKNEPWTADNAARAVALFPNKSLHTCAAILAGLHPFAYDYIATAPVIVLAVSEGSTLSKVLERKRVSREWVDRFEKGGKLRKLMAAANLSYPLRKLHPSILESGQWKTIQDLCAIESISRNVSNLEQIIPAREDQKDWLHHIGMWAAQMDRRFQNRLKHFEWACRQFNPDNMRRLNVDVRDMLNQVGNIADFAGADNTGFNPLWTISTAVQETRRWHEEMARAGHEKQFFMQHGLGWDEPVDYTPFPSCVRLEGYQFVALQSGKQLFEEGRDMHHCVGSYSNDVIKGRSRIYAMTDTDSNRIATVEFSGQKSGLYHYQAQAIIDGVREDTATAIHTIDKQNYKPQWHLVQAKGPCNAALSKDATKVVKIFEERLNYYWAMFEHERRQRPEYELRLARAMLNPMPSLIIERTEFPGLDQELLDQIATERGEVITSLPHESIRRQREAHP